MPPKKSSDVNGRALHDLVLRLDERSLNTYRMVEQVWLKQISGDEQNCEQNKTISKHSFAIKVIASVGGTIAAIIISVIMALHF